MENLDTKDFVGFSNEMKHDIMQKINSLSPESLQIILGIVNRELKSDSSKLSAAQRYNLFPLQDKEAYDFAEEQIELFWTASELVESLNKDKETFNSLPSRIQEICCLIFGFFVAGDGLVTRNIDRFRLECTTYEESFFYQVQAFIEAIHAQAYNLSADIILSDDPRKDGVFEMINSLECMVLKKNFMEKYIESDLSLSLRYVAAAAMEGIFFMGLFAVIFYLRQRNYLHGFVHLNEFVRRDETLHRNFFCMKAKKTLNQSEHSQAQEILREAVEVETAFINYLLSSPITSVKVDTEDKILSSDIEIYLKMLADQILDRMNVPTLFPDSEIFLTYVDDVSVKHNFYEKKVSQYVSGSRTSEKTSERTSKKKKLATF